MRIQVPTQFKHAADLPHHFADLDPRVEDTFRGQALEIDLRECSFVRPAAVLWCLIYPLLARLTDTDCRLLVPTNMGVSTYLKSLGLFTLLSQHGVTVDERGISNRNDPQLVLPLTGFRHDGEVEELANAALERLADSGLGAANLHPLISEVFPELALNAVQHAQSPVGGFGFIQFYASSLFRVG